MTALCIASGILLLLLVMPVGIRAVFDGDLTVWLTLFGLRLQLFSGKEKPQPKKKKKNKKPSPSPAGEKKKLVPQGDLAAYLRLFTQLLGKLHRKIRIRELMLHAVFGGSNPELNYGRAWAAIGCLMPLIEENFRIQKRDVGAFLSEDEKKIRILARAHAVLTLAAVLHIALHALRGYLKIRKNSEKAVT